MSSPLVRLTLWLFLAFSPQSVYGSWQYTDGQTDMTGGFTHQATVTETAANTFSGSSASIPATVPILITVNTTNFQGQPIQYNESVNCTAHDFCGFTLISDASIFGYVTFDNSFKPKGNDLTVNESAIHKSGSLTFGSVIQCSSDPDIRLEITGDYLQQNDADKNGSYESPRDYDGRLMGGGYHGDYGPFKGCSSISDLSIGCGGNIGTVAFRGLTKLINVTFNGIPIPTNSGIIGDYAFQEFTLLDNVVLPEEITHIRGSDFAGCLIQSIAIPVSLASWRGKFESCSNLMNVRLPEGLQSVPDYAFDGCDNFQTIRLPDSVTRIGVRAFMFCETITRLNNPDNLTTIGFEVFERCVSLKFPIFSPNVISKEDNTYAARRSLDNFIFPRSITRIVSSAFTNCTNLTLVTIPGTVTEILIASLATVSECGGFKRGPDSLIKCEPIFLRQPVHFL